MSKNKEGYSTYCRKFGRLNLPLPAVLDIGSIHWNNPEFAMEEVGKYLSECVAANKKATLRGYVDFFYLKDGVYEGWGIKSQSFDEFIALAKKASKNILF